MPVPWEFSGTATTTEQSTDLQHGQLEAIVNDGDDDIIFGLGGPTDGNQVRTVKAGEQYSGMNLGIVPKVLYYKSASGNQDFRVWVVR